MPKGAKILTVQMQLENPFMWCLVDPDAELHTRRFELIGTGHLFDNGLREYIGTFQLTSNLVFHLFEL